MARNLKRGDIDAEYHAIRARLTALRTTSSATISLPPHGHAASAITFDPTQGDGGRLAGDDVQEVCEELDSEKLARSGEQPMLGNLDMNHNDVNNVRNLEVEQNIELTGGNGTADINGVRDINFSGDNGEGWIDSVRNIFFAGDVGEGDVIDVRDISFEGNVVGEGVIDQPRVIHMTGDDDDGEARIDGLEAVVFNDEVTKSYIETVSRIQWNYFVQAGVNYGAVPGYESWDFLESDLVAWVESGSTTVKIALGWDVIICVVRPEGEAPYNVAFGQAVYAVGEGGGTWAVVDAASLPGVEAPELVSTYQIQGIALSDATSDDFVAVLRRGYIRGFTPPSGSWSLNDLIWVGSDGYMTNVRPDGPETQYFVGTVVTTNDGGAPYDVAVDIRTIPNIGELTGVRREAPEHRDVMVYDDTDQVWEPRPIRPSRNISSDETLNRFDYLVRVDASGGQVTVTLPLLTGFGDPPTSNHIVVVKKTDSSVNYVVIDGNGAAIDDNGTHTLVKQGETLMMQSDGNTWAVM